MLFLAAATVTLAVLQWRWTNELADRQRERLHASLRTASVQFAWEFNQSLIAAQQAFALHLPLEDEWSEGRIIAALTENYQVWQHSNHSRLVQDIVYVPNVDAPSMDASNISGQMVLRRFVPETQSFATVRPDSAEALQAVLASSITKESPMLISRITSDFAGIVIPLGQFSRRPSNGMAMGVMPKGAFLGKIPFGKMSSGKSLKKMPFQTPAFAKPLPPSFESIDNEAAADAFPARLMNTGVVLIRFNQEYIRATMLPALAQRYFSHIGEGDALEACEYAIVERLHSSRMLYASPHATATTLTQPDAIVPIGIVPPRASRSFPFMSRGLTSRLPMLLADSTLFRVDEREKDNHDNDTRMADSSVTQTNTSTSANQHLRDTLFIHHETYGQEESRRHGMMAKIMEGELNRWRLYVRATGDGIESEIRSLRWRNLALSFGVLMAVVVATSVALRAAVRSERLARQQMQFVAGVSHEFRTPLAVLRSASDNLADGIVRTPEQARRYGAMMKRDINRLWEMVEQTLTFAGIQSGRQAYPLVPTELAEVVTDAVKAATPFIEEAGCTLVVEYPTQAMKQGLERELERDGAHCIVNANATALSAAIVNLLTNAAKYSDAGGAIRLVIAERDEMVTIAVIDEGIGIAADEQRRIFEPFYRSKVVTEAQIHGNGLGLALADYIVKQHGGRITVASELGRGSVFTIMLLAAAVKGKEHEVVQ